MLAVACANGVNWLGCIGKVGKRYVVYPFVGGWMLLVYLLGWHLQSRMGAWQRILFFG